MTNLRNTLFIILGIFFAVILLIWLGLQIQPKPFSKASEQSQSVETISLPDDLPAPVTRFYKTVYGDQIPVINSVVITGRGVLKPFMNIRLPARFVFIHDAGKNYRHYFEATIFGIPVLKVNEGYIDKKSFFDNQMVSITNDPNNNQAANLTLWAEAIWFPAIWITNPNVRWESVDENTALLYVPFEDKEENFLVRFNPNTGMIDTMQSMRYRDPGDKSKTLWVLTDEQNVPLLEDGIKSIGSAMWMDQGSPWAYFDVDKIMINVDISEIIYQKGYSSDLKYGE